MATYSLDNFIKTPVQGDRKLEIYDASGNLQYMLDPLDVNFFYRNNKVIIHHLRTEIQNESCRNHTYVELDFISEGEAILSTTLANTNKNILLTFFNETIVLTDTVDGLRYVVSLSGGTFVFSALL